MEDICFGVGESAPPSLRAVPDPMVSTVPIDSLRPGEQVRSAGEDEEHVAMLAECGRRLPPVLVDPATMRVIDGMHRLSAAQRRGESHVDVEFFRGTDTDAFIAAVERNTAQGLPLSRKDRLSAAVRIVAARPQWSNRVIAAKVGLSDKTVAAVRQRSSSDIPQTNVRFGRDGRARPADISVGRKRAVEFISLNPEASLREIAAAAGIAVATARDVRIKVQDGVDPISIRRGVGATVTGRRDRNANAQPDIAELAKALSQLRNDPTLRFTDAGRLVLRLLDAHQVDACGWRSLLDRLPAHCVDRLADAARNCAQTWQFVETYLRDRSIEG